VAVIIAIVKFSEGAWMVMLAVPIMVAVLVRVKRVYEAEEHDLLEGVDSLATMETRSNIAIVLVEEMDQRAVDAVNYALTIRPDQIRAVSFFSVPDEGRLKHAWTHAGPLVPLDEIICPNKDREEVLREYVAKFATHDVNVTVIFSVPSRISALHRILHGRSWSETASALRGFENVMVVAVRNSGGRGGPDGSPTGMRLALHPRHRVVILVGRLDRSVVKAIRYARSVDALDVTALHVGVDPVLAHRLLEEWWRFGRTLETPLEIQESLDRNIPRVVRDYVRTLRASASDVTVVLPRNDYSGLFQRLLHDRTSRGISEALRDEPGVHLVVVPYQLSSEARTRHRGDQEMELIRR
jgi:hypothetical protein